MKSIILKDIINVIGGKLKYGDDSIKVKNAVIRNKYLKDNTIFFNLDKTDKINWSEYGKYKNFIIVTENIDYSLKVQKEFTIVIVKDINDAYWRFIKYYRDLFSIPVIAVTGTCGKTTTKEMTKHILSKFYNVNATYLSKNSLSMNLPYLMDIDDNTQAAVYETGVAYPEDLLISCKYFSPNIGIITNIGIDHLDGCKTHENYIKAKATMIQGLNYKGALILNGDDENIKKINLDSFNGNIVYFGTNENCDFRAINIKYGKKGMEFTITHEKTQYKAVLPGYGNHNVYNALASIAAAYTLGISITDSAKILKTYKYVSSHTQLRNGINGSTIIDDTWSSNPTSTKAALKVLKKLSKGKKTIIILGKMSLLGEYETRFYSEIGELVYETGIDTLITVGGVTKAIAKRALELGMDKSDVYMFKNGYNLFGVMKSLLDEDTILLVKTSMLDHSTDDLMKKIVIKSK